MRETRWGNVWPHENDLRFWISGEKELTELYLLVFEGRTSLPCGVFSPSAVLANPVQGPKSQVLVSVSQDTPVWLLLRSLCWLMGVSFTKEGALLESASAVFYPPPAHPPPSLLPKKHFHPDSHCPMTVNKHWCLIKQWSPSKWKRIIKTWMHRKTLFTLVGGRRIHTFFYDRLVQ